MAYDYDLFVIGGGSGGVRAARRVGGLGKKVGLAESSRMGGTCVIRGCVPKKLYVYASTFPEQFEDAEGYGWIVGETAFDWRKLRTAKEAEVTRLEGLYRSGLTSSGVEIFDTHAELRGPHEVWLKAEDRVVTAERIVVAVGGYPNPHAVLKGHEHTITSDEAFDLEDLPERIVIAGAGYIAIEFAGIFSGLGVDVTILYRGLEILSGFDDDMREHLHAEYEQRGIKIITQDVFREIELRDDGVRVCHLASGKTIEAEQVMLALGRLPSTSSLGLDQAGVETDDKGHIPVDEFSRTNVPSIWALGDVTNRVQLTPVAIHEAMCFLATEYLDRPEKPDHDTIATAVFSHPEIGTVGITETEAGNRGGAYAVFKSTFRPMKYVLAGRQSKMVMKLIVDESDDRVVGAHIIGPDAGEMAQLIGISMKMGAKKSDFDATMALHPSAADELVTMYEPSYRVVDGVRVEV
ncbi:MAG: glutathione-disulfide reductase [Pseudomonadota bacterium]